MKKGKKSGKNDDEVKIVVFGSGGVGKSALIVQLIQNVFVEAYDPTLEDSYRKETTLSDGRPVTLDILDTAGQEEFHTLRDQYIRQGEGYIIVYSITNRSSFEEVEQFLEQILQSKDIEPHELELAREIPIVIVGNKCDLEEQRCVRRSDGERLAVKYGGISFYEASAKTRAHVTESFMDCTKQIIEKVKKKKSTSKGCVVC